MKSLFRDDNAARQSSNALFDSLAKLLSKDEVRRIAANIATLPGSERLADADNHMSRRSKMSPATLATVGSRAFLAKDAASGNLATRKFGSLFSNSAEQCRKKSQAVRRWRVG
jgi:hypothetical protein